MERLGVIPLAMWTKCRRSVPRYSMATTDRSHPMANSEARYYLPSITVMFKEGLETNVPIRIPVD